MNRCVNIDWLQVFCSEPLFRALDADYYKQQGYEVKARDYGTPQYQEMFTIYENGFPFIEVRRKPYSLKRNGGIFNENDCHLRLSNRACYSVSPIDDLRKFILAHGYEYHLITRIDVCLDFNFFDFGDNPAKILTDYMEGKYSKINQCNIAAHGKDKFAGRYWNSLSWGSQKSPISTKMYNKSQELREVTPKYYIQDSWQAAGLRLDVDVWRVEFSIKSDIKGFVKTDTGEIFSNTLNDYDNREKCLFRFHALANKYFHFKYVEYLKNGKLQRKDRCKDKVLFKLTKDERTYKPVKLTDNIDPTRTDRLLVKRLYEMQDNFQLNAEQRKAATEIIMLLHQKMRTPVDSSRFSNLILSLEKAVQ